MSDPITAAEAAERFCDHLTDVDKKAPNTIRGDMRPIRLFLKNSPSDLLTSDFTCDMFATFATEHLSTTYRGEPMAETTYNLRIGQLRRWLLFCLEEGWLGEDLRPWRKLKPIEEPKPARQKAYIRRGDKLQALFEAACRWHKRDGYFIVFSYWTSRRYSEVATMKVGDIDFTPRPMAEHGVYHFTQIKTRGRREWLDLPEPLVGLLKEWLEVYAELIGRKLLRSDYLFPALKVGKGNMATKGLRQPLVLVPTEKLPFGSATDLINRAFATAGIEKAEGEGTHGLRRGGLDDLVHDAHRAGLPDGLALAQVKAGHKSRNTTEGYLDTSRAKQALGEAQAKIYGTPVTEAAEDPAEVTEASNVLSMAEMRKRRSRTA